MNSRIHPKYKTKYHVQNWQEYECGLVERGDITVWLSLSAIAAWRPKRIGRPGGQASYSDLAIETALTMRLVFGLPLRQAEGFLRSLFRLMGLELPVPDHTTLSRRSKVLEVQLRISTGAGPIHLVVDSTGLAIVENFFRLGQDLRIFEEIIADDAFDRLDIPIVEPFAGHDVGGRQESAPQKPGQRETGQCRFVLQCHQ